MNRGTTTLGAILMGEYVITGADWFLRMDCQSEMASTVSARVVFLTLSAYQSTISRTIGRFCP